MPLHISKGKSAGKCIGERLDYIMNPDKTESGNLISSFACAPETADIEFMLCRSEYLMKTGRDISNEIIGYHIRQAFKPGEITPDEANRIGKELASKISNDAYAYIVATHTDRKHIHNHIIMCSYPLDGDHKYRDVKRSAKDLMRLSDELCRENGLSIVSDPQGKTVTYDKWLGSKKKSTGRDYLRMAIDAALRLNPDGFDALMQLMEEAGCRIKRSAQIAIQPPNGKRYIRLDTLGDGYSEDALRKKLEGHLVHIPKVPRSDYTESQVKLLIDIEARMRAGKGKGYQVWAERHNIDAKAQSVIYLKENHIGSKDELEERIQLLSSEQNELRSSIRENQNRMKEISRLRRAIRNYCRTKDVYTQYRESGWSPKFYNEHRRDIETHKEAQAVYSSHEGTMPSIKQLNAEYEDLIKLNAHDRAEMNDLDPELTTLKNIRYNLDVLDRDFLPESKPIHRTIQEER